jgi:formylglycine-generating enzyme required for sulfatase activity
MTPPPVRDQLFISYSHLDREWVERLQAMIRPLLSNHGVSLWDDSRIQPGDNWREEIEKALASAKVALLLVSDDFLASEFVINKELPPLLRAAEAEGLCILWVCLRPCFYEATPIREYQAVLPPGEPLEALSPMQQKKALKTIAGAIQEALGNHQDSPPAIRLLLRLLRWPARTQVFHEELGEAERLTMVRIPAGSFQMGSAEQEPGRHANEGPVHTVTLAEFLIGQTPITQAQWRAVARWTPQQGERWGRELNPEPAKFQGEEARLLAGETNTDGRPVERVSWEDAIEFCSRLSQRTGRNYTLPSEAQWEYVCRAGTSTAYCFGDIIYSDLANFRGTDASRFSSPAPDPQPLFREQTIPVGMFPANAWGLYDMHGNVSEWCLDSVHSSYEGGPYDGSAWEDPQAPKIEQRITRGGSWSMPPRCCRSAFRFPYRSPSKADVPDVLYDDVGFRLVCLPKSVT